MGALDPWACSTAWMIRASKVPLAVELDLDFDHARGVHGSGKHGVPNNLVDRCFLQSQGDWSTEVIPAKITPSSGTRARLDPNDCAYGNGRDRALSP